MSEISARASRRAFCLGSCTRNGFTARSGPVLRCATPPPAPPPPPAVEGVWAAGGAGGAGGEGGTGDGTACDGLTGGITGAALGRGRGGAGWTGASCEGAGEGAGVKTGAAASTGKTLLQTAHRARVPPAGTLAGSTR